MRGRHADADHVVGAQGMAAEIWPLPGITLVAARRRKPRKSTIFWPTVGVAKVP